MGAKHDIWCFKALHQCMMFLPSQGRTLTHASIINNSLARSHVASIVYGTLIPSWKHQLYALAI